MLITAGKPLLRPPVPKKPRSPAVLRACQSNCTAAAKPIHGWLGGEDLTRVACQLLLMYGVHIRTYVLGSLLNTSSSVVSMSHASIACGLQQSDLQVGLLLTGFTEKADLFFTCSPVALHKMIRDLFSWQERRYLLWHSSAGTPSGTPSPELRSFRMRLHLHFIY